MTLYDAICTTRMSLLTQLRDHIALRDTLNPDADNYADTDYICGELTAAIDALENIEMVWDYWTRNSIEPV